MGNEGEKSLIKGLGFRSFALGSNVTLVKVKDGRIIRTRPLHFELNYKPKIEF